MKGERMGAINGFRLDVNGDGKISRKEFQRAKNLGLDVSYMDNFSNINESCDLRIFLSFS